MSDIIARVGRRCDLFKQVWPIIKEHIEKVNVNEMANAPLNGDEGYTEFSVGVEPRSILEIGKESHLVSFRLTVRIDDECETTPELRQAVAEEAE